MPADTTNYRLTGDRIKCRQIQPIAREGIHVLRMLVNLSGLNTYQLNRRLEDGSHIRVWTAYGAYYAEIYGMPAPEEKPQEKEKPKEEIRDIVLVYIGLPDNPFSEFSIADMVERTVLFWGTVPELTLEKLPTKKLLVLPCPVRALTSNEVDAINTFLKTKGNRVAVFCGDDVDSANSVLTSLNSMLEYIKSSAFGDSHSYDTAGYLPLSANEKQLFWLYSKVCSTVGVKKEYWSQAAVKDFHGFGIAYDNITNLSPCKYAHHISPIGEYDIPFNNMTEYYRYTENMQLYGRQLDEKFNSIGFSQTNRNNFHWDIDAWEFDDVSYTTDYITYNNDDVDKDDLINWCNANKELLPFGYVYRYDEAPTRTKIGYADFWDYKDCDKYVNVFSGSVLAFADDEQIIVGSFKPYFLVAASNSPITTATMLTCYPLNEFANWLVFYDLTPNHDMFNTRGFFTLAPPFNYVKYIEFWGSGTQY